MVRTIYVCLLALFLPLASSAQQGGGTIRGLVADETGAIIPGAKVTATGPGGAVRTATSDNTGRYAIPGLAPGNYTVVAVSPGLAQYQPASAIVAGTAVSTANLQLRVAAAKQEVTVRESSNTTVSTDPANNAGQLVLREEDIQALSDDPDDLANDLQALAGPSAGPNGGQIYIDGFTGGRLPPKESIREIRINSNPFSAEYDRLGFGRIEIFTKPGSDKFRGQGFFSYSNGIWNSRNPFATNKPDFQMRQYGGNLSGPISKRSSFFVDFEKRDIDDNSIINATTLDANLNPLVVAQALLRPQRRTTFSPRLDYALNDSNTLMARYTFTRNETRNAGITEFDLPTRGYNSGMNEHTFQLTETAVLSPKAINETRLQFIALRNDKTAQNNLPTINVLESFTGGGAQVGLSYSDENRLELQNYTTLTHGTHSTKFGLRLRGLRLADVSRQNFGGTYIFSGGVGPQLDPTTNQPLFDPSGAPLIGPISSLERYRRTLLFQQQGLSPQQIRMLGGGATQFTLSAGNPKANVSQIDAGLFLQDDWRLRPNFTLSLGLRYETQNHLRDWTDFAPRIGFAWAPGQSKKSLRPKTVIRGGWGIFYDRFSENLTLQAERFNGVNQLQYRIQNPEFYPNIPSLESLGSARRAQSMREIDRSVRAPYLMQSAIGIERQLPFNTSAAVTFTNSHAVHLLRSRDINAPLPGTYNPANPNSGVRPFGDVGEIDLFESTGILNQKQLLTNVNTRIGTYFSLFGGYALNFAKSNTDGASSFPANQYDLSSEYGRAAIDIRHRLFLGGSVTTKFGIRLNPFIIARSGAPFNITTGRDIYGDTLFTARPAFATDLTKPGVVVTRFGAFDPNPTANERIIPRNFAQGPGYFSINLRVSKTFGFGPERAGAAPGGGGDFGGGGGGGRRGGGPPGGGMRMGGGPRGMFGEGGTNHRYNLILSVQARNLMNSVNPAPPIGNITSPLFGTSNALAGGFGPESAIANNRRIDLQLRFTF